ncbi:SprT family protein [Bacillus phage vB_BanS-Thrax2]|nr:SprT family protein [Bacillus phage vB_BanS-Thrax2]
MTETQLTRYANEFLMKNYGMRLTVPLKLNGRLSKTLGWFIYKKKANKPVAVHLNKKFVQNNDEDIILNVLRHELVHYALFMQGKPHGDGQTYFENELKRKGIVSQSTINQYTVNSVKQIYKCLKCEYMHKRSRKFSNVSRYKCTCGGKLEYIGKRVVAS